MRLAQDVDSPPKFYDDFLYRVNQEELTPELEYELACQYAECYPFGVPLKLAKYKKSITGDWGQTWFKWRSQLPRSDRRGDVIHFVIRGQHCFQMVKNNMGTVTPYCLTDPREFVKREIRGAKKFFGLPAMAAACLFLRSGKKKPCSICSTRKNKVYHEEKITGRFLKLHPGLITEWEAEDYEQYKITTKRRRRV